MGCNCDMFLFRYRTCCHGVSSLFASSCCCCCVCCCSSSLLLSSDFSSSSCCSYIQTIQSALKPGGYWINIGPLLYHWASSDPGVASGAPSDERYSQSIEVCLVSCLVSSVHCDVIVCDV